MAQILYITNILIDFGVLAQLPAECERAGIRRPLIVTDAGVKAVVQPGGSMRDEEVIAAADAAGITMYFTGERHFFH